MRECARGLCEEDFMIVFIALDGSVRVVDRGG